MAARKISNMLALAVLSLLHEKPMHPYEISATMKERGIPDVIKLNNGSLYSVVEALLKQGWIIPLETQREGRHPERTIYAPTETGRVGFHDWLREMVYEPAKEYPQFPAALAFIGHIPPPEMIELLELRIGFINKSIAERRAGIEFARGIGLSRIFVIESEYIIHQLDSELRWLTAFKEDIKNGSLTEQSEGETIWHMTTPADDAQLQNSKLQSKGTTLP
ncbi:PadR family transcriptional regulator [Paenibacillus sp. PR3]|uniref:PadR family transcriptional regulator n=1 Tax=Paenibacillus terricola TaxID=2763503 RepID=A0ABR8N1A9_9BACL|nr:PadR family transcriptional regulator [Paenibacillus terricola]MBD3921962.1 PadR family transcriptional regulator [Paenibacillus terricola]